MALADKVPCRLCRLHYAAGALDPCFRRLAQVDCVFTHESVRHRQDDGGAR